MHAYDITPVAIFHTYFYNHARRLRLEKLLYPELSRSPNGHLAFKTTSRSRWRFRFSETTARRFRN
jgi:hypothetical protein